MQRKILVAGSIIGALSVMLGAFAAHSLKQIFAAENLQTFETAVRYQFYHVFAMLAVGILYKNYNNRLMNYSFYCFLLGIILFSGSLYFLCLSKHYNWQLNSVGIITPFGGLFFIAGWCCLALAIAKK